MSALYFTNDQIPNPLDFEKKNWTVGELIGGGVPPDMSHELGCRHRFLLPPSFGIYCKVTFVLLVPQPILFWVHCPHPCSTYRVPLQGYSLRIEKNPGCTSTQVVFIWSISVILLHVNHFNYKNHDTGLITRAPTWA